jgi:octopine/nopaline transport system substrate-binding protein
MLITRKSFLKAGIKAGLAAAGLSAGLARPALAKEWTTIRVATEGAFPPFNATAPDGTLIGFEPDMCAEIAKRQKVKITLLAQAWDGIIPGLNDGKYDAIVDGMSITPKREEIIAFSQPYTSSPSGFTVLKDGPLANMPGTGTRIALDDDAAAKEAAAAIGKALAGKTVAVQTATIQFDFLNRYLKDAVTVRTYAAGPDTYLDLKNGRADAVLSSVTNAAPFIKRGRGELVLSGYGFTGGVLGRGSAIGLRKTDPELKAIFDAGLQSMIADGSLTALSMKWFELDVTPKA